MDHREVGRPLRRVPGLGHARRDRRGHRAHRRGPPGRAVRAADRAGRRRGRAVLEHRGRRVRPGARRGHRARLGRPRRGRARHRQVDPAARRRRPRGSPPARPLRERRGVGGAGAGPGPAHRRPRRRALPHERDRPGHRPGAPRRARPGARGRRLGADPRLGRGRRRGGQRQPGARGGRGPHPAGEGRGHRDAARRPRDEGRLDRRAADARAPRRRRRAVRRRPPLAAAARAGGEEQVRPDRRIHSCQIGTTRATGVCCDITSETKTSQGVVPAARHGRSRACSSNQRSTRRWTCASSVSAVLTTDLGPDRVRRSARGWRSRPGETAPRARGGRGPRRRPRRS